MKSFRKIFFSSPFPAIAAVYLTVSLLLRLVLWWSFGRPSGIVPERLPVILGLGAVNDLAELIRLLAPLAFYLFLVPSRIVRTKWHHRLLAGVTYLSLVGMLYISASEYFFFQEFDSRFNLVAVDYLVYPHEVWGNIRASYPVFPFLLAAFLLALAFYQTVRPGLREWFLHPPRFAKRSKAFLAYLLVTALFFTGYSDDTFARSSNRVENELTANGISSFFRAFETHELDYHLYYSTLKHDRAFRMIRRQLAGEGGTFTSTTEENLNRAFPPDPAGLGKMNVVVIVEESFGAGFIGAYGDRRGLTPAFDKLAGEGLLFQNTYATGTRTVRGLEAITASFPPIPSVSILRRPGNERIATWGKVMADNGYITSFLYGGYGYFDNMNHFYRSNGFAISDRREIREVTFANIWGVCDEDLFNHALKYFDGPAQQGRPFFSIIMTTSNHKPFTFPKGIPGIPPSGGGRKSGVRYADYALGNFIRRASQHPWFGNTLFVIVADHDARVYGRLLIPVRHYRIPLLMYAPGKLKPKRIPTPTSQIDIAPTVLGLLGLPYNAPFYGCNILKLPAGESHPVFLSHNLDVSLFENNRLTVLGIGAKRTTFRYLPEKHRLLPERGNRKMEELTTAYYQTAFELFKSRRYR
ncbi:MAG: sulfatase-like hydrolase/transferase [Deltaproteobacteria bacterium]|nr:sulfatase-like hydrolase/transferase [Deltaproteobacteria bacterium]